MKKTNKKNMKNIIGPRVKEARMAATKPVSQDDLAGRLAKHGITMDRSAISRIENQDRYVMDYEVVALSKCLKVSTGFLLEGKK